MKRSMFYVVIISQVFVLLFLVIQFERIDRHGQMIKLLTAIPTYSIYDETLIGDVYIDFEINQISDEMWHINDSITTNDRVYVLLESDANGIYHVVDATTEKITAQHTDEFVLIGTYSYSDEHHNSHFVNYGIEWVKNIEQFGNFNAKQDMIVTLLVSERWGQRKMVTIEDAHMYFD